MTEFEAVVVGTGFGGSVSACRLARKWGDRVLVLERGRRYRPGDFARTPAEMADNWWNLNGEQSGVPRSLGREQRGLFDVRSFRRMDALVAAGYGGGSLIYANVIMRPPDEVLRQDCWPASCRSATLAPYYDIVRDVLQARPVPIDDSDRRVPRTAVFQRAAEAMGRSSELVDVAVFFGNDPDEPLARGAREANRHGVEQTSCTYCAECDVGCNEGAKNTLDMNYLHVAEHRHHARIRTDCVAERIAPLGDDGTVDVEADGTHGFEVMYHDIEAGERVCVTTRRVVVSAGALGSTELLLRCRDVERSLPRLGDRLGHRFSGNGDFLGFVVGAPEATTPQMGPVITQRIDCNLFDDHDPRRGFILEDAGYPNWLAYYVEGVKPGVRTVTSVLRTARRVVDRWVVGRSGGRIGYVAREMMRDGDLTGRAALMLCMGLDNAEGRLHLTERGWLQVDWPMRDNIELYRAIVRTGKRFQEAVGARWFSTIPTWSLPFRRNVTVHCLGGCVLADDPDRGVVSAAPDTFGEVFGYRNLSVADGAIVPAAVGANPAATIAALSEMVAERITGIRPTADL